MAGRLNHRGWRVLASVQTYGGDFCVDLFEHPEGGYGFEQFRRDVEDSGSWTQTSAFSVQRFNTLADALAAAEEAIGWLTSDSSARSQLFAWRERDHALLLARSGDGATPPNDG
jgi:hypothetical protein